MTRAYGDHCSNVGKSQFPVQIVLYVLDGAPQLPLGELRREFVGSNSRRGVMLEQMQRELVGKRLDVNPAGNRLRLQASQQSYRHLFDVTIPRTKIVLDCHPRGRDSTLFCGNL